MCNLRMSVRYMKYTLCITNNYAMHNHVLVLTYSHNSPVNFLPSFSRISAIKLHYESWKGNSSKLRVQKMFQNSKTNLFQLF